MTTKTPLTELVRNYILNAITSDGYDVEPQTDEEKVKFLLGTFKSEYCYPQNWQRYKTGKRIFAEWVQGLPSSFSVHFYNYDILNIAKAWDLLPFDATEEDEDKFIAGWWSFLADEVAKLAKEYNLELGK